MSMRVAGLVTLILMAAACAPPAPRPASDTATGLRYLTIDDAPGFARATTPRPFVFPADHGPHPEFRSEWWYFTGNLETADARQFGFELTLFRFALGPRAAASGGSAFRTNEIFMAHFAITDEEAKRFDARERTSRGALGLAGTATEPLRVWVKDWSITLEPTGRWRLDARDGDMALALALDTDVPPVAQGDGGLDRKGPEPGNASYYYSVPRLRARGSLETGGQTFDVTGRAWLDREWGTSALGSGVVGWDWFALQLADGGDLMFYRLRRAGGDASEFSGGTFVDATGRVTHLAARDVEVAASGTWESRVTGSRYPSGWRLRVPTLDLALDVEPYLEDQEVDLSVRYWEGAVRAAGNLGPARISALGYVELTGY
jgi:predicted secreted hydrolase